MKETPTRIKRARLGLLLVVIAVASVTANRGRLFGQTTPAPLPNCTGLQLNSQGNCSAQKVCAGSSPCSSWVTPTATPMCQGGGVAGDNCIADKDQFKNCGTRGTCQQNKAGVCVNAPGINVIQTNPVKDGGSCLIPASSPVDTASD